MPKRKQPISLTEQVRQEVLREHTRINGEDYEEWCEFIRYETDARLQEIQKRRNLFFSRKEKDL